MTRVLFVTFSIQWDDGTTTYGNTEVIFEGSIRGMDDVRRLENAIKSTIPLPPLRRPVLLSWREFE